MSRRVALFALLSLPAAAQSVQFEVVSIRQVPALPDDIDHIEKPTPN
jgi:hypothetical protein